MWSLFAVCIVRRSEHWAQNFGWKQGNILVHNLEIACSKFKSSKNLMCQDLFSEQTARVCRFLWATTNWVVACWRSDYILVNWSWLTIVISSSTYDGIKEQWFLKISRNVDVSFFLCCMRQTETYETSARAEYTIENEIQSYLVPRRHFAVLWSTRKMRPWETWEWDSTKAQNLAIKGSEYWTLLRAQILHEKIGPTLIASILETPWW